MNQLSTQLQESNMTETKFTCEICNTANPPWSWTDTHGVAQCFKCGAAYRLYHYQDDKRIEKPPELAIKAEWNEFCKRFYTETRKRMPSGYSIPGGYELGDIAEWNEFCRNNKESRP